MSSSAPSSPLSTLTGTLPSPQVAGPSGGGSDDSSSQVIVGGSIAAAFVLFAVVIGLFLHQRHRRRYAESEQDSQGIGAGSVTKAKGRRAAARPASSSDGSSAGGYRRFDDDRGSRASTASRMSWFYLDGKKQPNSMFVPASSTTSVTEDIPPVPTRPPATLQMQQMHIMAPDGTINGGGIGVVSEMGSSLSGWAIDADRNDPIGIMSTYNAAHQKHEAVAAGYSQPLPHHHHPQQPPQQQPRGILRQPQPQNVSPIYPPSAAPYVHPTTTSPGSSLQRGASLQRGNSLNRTATTTPSDSGRQIAFNRDSILSTDTATPILLAMVDSAASNSGVTGNGHRTRVPPSPSSAGSNAGAGLAYNAPAAANGWSMAAIPEEPGQTLDAGDVPSQATGPSAPASGPKPILKTQPGGPSPAGGMRVTVRKLSIASANVFPTPTGVVQPTSANVSSAMPDQHAPLPNPDEYAGNGNPFRHNTATAAVAVLGSPPLHTAGAGNPFFRDAASASQAASSAPRGFVPPPVGNPFREPQLKRPPVSAAATRGGSFSTAPSPFDTPSPARKRGMSTPQKPDAATLEAPPAGPPTTPPRAGGARIDLSRISVLTTDSDLSFVSDDGYVPPLPVNRVTAARAGSLATASTAAPPSVLLSALNEAVSVPIPPSATVPVPKPAPGRRNAPKPDDDDESDLDSVLGSMVTASFEGQQAERKVQQGFAAVMAPPSVPAIPAAASRPVKVGGGTPVGAQAARRQVSVAPVATVPTPVPVPLASPPGRLGKVTSPNAGGMVDLPYGSPLAQRSGSGPVKPPPLAPASSFAAPRLPSAVGTLAAAASPIEMATPDSTPSSLTGFSFTTSGSSASGSPQPAPQQPPMPAQPPAPLPPAHLFRSNSTASDATTTPSVYTDAPSAPGPGSNPASPAAASTLPSLASPLSSPDFRCGGGSATGYFDAETGKATPTPSTVSSATGGGWATASEDGRGGEQEEEEEDSVDHLDAFMDGFYNQPPVPVFGTGRRE
ncbi:hypothetical protein HDU96_000569 [Phlyctochytrium bullatum]|nr:hypothetical protein HDU96_000569 [Phlyctochytrium bullatum]